jgi:hypothetical protein
MQSEDAMKERPILFSASMVRALLAGTKTQTRRIIKDQSIGERFSHMTDDGLAHLEWLGTPCCGSGVWDVQEYSANVASPYGQPGDRLWVRETWAYGINAMASKRDEDGPFVYAADGTTQGRLCERWRPSIHMPRAASRIALEITGVRVERLQDIHPVDALKEGLEQCEDLPYRWDHPVCLQTAVKLYSELWEQINGPGSWAQNLWVWVVEFKRVQQASSGRPSQLEEAPCSA